MTETSKPPSGLKIWLTAVRPFAYTASALAVALGLAVAYSDGYRVQWGLCALTFVGVLCFHTAANLLNDCFDHRRGLDTAVLPTSGAIVRGWLTERQVFRAAMGCLAIGAVCGLLLTWLVGWVVLFLGLVGTVIALGYTTARFCFKYNGLGDVAIFLAFGILPVFGTYWVQSRTFCWGPLFWSIPLCSYTVAILHANNWRDIDRDGEARCVTPAVILGQRGSHVYYRLLILGPYVLVVGAIVLARVFGIPDQAPVSLAAVLLSLPIALRLSRLSPDRDEATFAMLDGKTAQLHMAFGVLAIIGFLIGRWV